MKYVLIVLLILAAKVDCHAQYSKEKISKLLTGENERSWSVTGINTERPEKKMTFNKNDSVKLELRDGSTANEKWALNSSDEIRWFLTLGNKAYELIISYDKKGNEYIKLTHKSGGNKSSGYSEFKLTPLK